MGKKGSQFINSPTLFECLPNEIVISIFSYLTGVDAVLAFSDLNYRFNCLTNQYCYLFDFKSVNKTKFDFIIHQQQTKHQWKSLQLSNDDDTPGQIEYFSQLYSLIDICPQLQSLSLLNINDISRNNPSLLLFANLQSLTIKPICGTIISDFNLSKLKRLVITTCKNIEWLKNLSQLEIFEYTIMDDCSCEPNFTWPFTLKRLKIIFMNSHDLILLQLSFICLSQLTILEIYQNDGSNRNIQLDGQIWEQTIRSLFPLLKHFRFLFRFHSINLSTMMASFSTPFYLVEKQWFVRCDLSHRDNFQYSSVTRYDYQSILYSLPLTFESPFTYRYRNYTSISTLPKDCTNNSYTDMYTNMKTLVLPTDIRSLDEKFNRIKPVNLTIDGSIHSINCWNHIFAKLQHLSFSKNAEMSSELFEILLNNTPDLYSLELDTHLLPLLTNNWTNTTICNQLSNKIRCLKFHPAKSTPQCFSKKRLIDILSVFSSKCTYLSLSIQSKPDLIVFILKRLKHLHSLHIHINEKDHLPITMEWFNQQKTRLNHANCFITQKEHNYYFWLGKDY